MKKKVSLIIVSFLVLILFPVLSAEQWYDKTLAGKKDCESVRMLLHNKLSYPIKVTGLYFYDYEKKRWRVKAILPKIIKSNDSRELLGRRHLRNVKNKKTYFKVVFRKGKINRRGKYKYRGKKDFKYTQKFTCNDSMNQFLSIGE
ncbi:MAG: hypothetical protein ABFR75_02185 [Acidobacteriota bacterium]